MINKPELIKQMFNIDRIIEYLIKELDIKFK